MPKIRLKLKPPPRYSEVTLNITVTVRTVLVCTRNSLHSA